MATDDPAVDAAALNDHYGAANLGAELLDALKAAGKDVDGLTRDDISSFDEFHIRGLDATRELAELADIDAGSHVLDIGSGVGGPARTLAAEFECDVVGIDLVEEYCRAARLFTDRVGLSERVRFRRGNALDLPFDAGRFDVVWLEHTLMNVGAKDRVFEEAGRVLRPGGTLALYEICAGTEGEPHFPVPWATGPSLNYLESPDRLREFVLDPGFEERAWRDVTAPSLEWFRDVVASMKSRPAGAPPPLGLNLLMGAETATKATNVVRNLEEDRIAVVQGVFHRMAPPAGNSSRSH